MKKLIILFAVITCVMAVRAAKFSYHFRNLPLSEALTEIAEQHGDIDINFIYNELNNYTTNATLDTDDIYEALRQTIGLNPVSIVNKGDKYYIEALQHGKFIYTGKVIAADREAVPGVTVMILAPRDSSVITYAVTDVNGHFLIPCDKRNIIVKFSCVGYKTVYKNSPAQSMGEITMHQLPVQLASISITSDQTILATDKNIYIPSNRQKNASRNATDLLRRMAIPQLIINPGEDAVKDVFGNSVPLYINYHTAEPDELQGMRITDVRKVEYIEFPTDPRFKGEQKVINFIVQEYEYGGYTKADESFTTLNGIYNNSTVFSRFTFKKMTYDLFCGSTNQDSHHNGVNTTGEYNLEKNGEPFIVNRKETFESAHNRSDQYPLTFRASYNTEKFSARNTLSLTHVSEPEQFMSGTLDVDAYPDNNYTYTRSSPRKHNTIYYHSNLWGLIRKNMSFDITPSFLHTHRNNISYYHSSLIGNSICNQITENAYNWGIQASGRLMIEKEHQFTLFLGGGQNINRLTYRGSNNMKDSYYVSNASVSINYRYQTKKISLWTNIGFVVNHTSMNHIPVKGIYPNISANMSLKLSRKSQLQVYMNYGSRTPGIIMKANDTIQSNEFMYFTANPYLKNYRNLTSNIAYNWFHSNALSVAVFGGFNRDFDRVATIYLPYRNGMAILRNFVNDGNYTNGYIGAGINYKLLDNNLQLYANITQNARHTSGCYDSSLYSFRVQLQAVYYWKNFNILASWGSPDKKLTENSNIIIRWRNFHMISLGWGNGIWTVNVAAKNIFNRGWRSETWTRNTPLYAEYQTYYNPSAHSSINISASYTIGYGRKVRRGDEVRGHGAAPSAILE